MIADVRRMTAVAVTDATHTTAVITAHIEKYPQIDQDSRDPDEASWTPIYDLNAAAAAIWLEKASAAASQFNFATDGSSFKCDQKYQHFMRQSRHYASRRIPGRIWHRADPRNTGRGSGRQELNRS